MKNFKFLKPVFLLLTMIVFTIGCSNETASSPNDDSEVQADATDTYTVNIAFGNQSDEPVGQLAERWKELAEEESGGALELNLYPNSQLGAEKDVVEQAKMGNNVIVMTGYDYLMDYVPDVGILTAPYLTESYDDLLYLTETEWFDGIKNDLESENIEVVNATTVYGDRHLLTNEKVESLEDLNNMSIRVPDNQVSVKTFEALGASATTYPLGELYTALQQGLVDGAENPISVLQGAKAHEVSKHLSLTGHQKFITAWIAGADYMDSLPDELVEVLKTTGDQAADYARGVLEEDNMEIMEEFKAEGVEVHEVDTQPFKEEAQKVYDEFPEWSPGLYEEIQDLLEKRP